MLATIFKLLKFNHIKFYAKDLSNRLDFDV